MVSGHSSHAECVSESIGLAAGNRLHRTQLPAAVSCEMTDLLLTFRLQLTQHPPPAALEVRMAFFPQSLDVNRIEHLEIICGRESVKQ